MKQLLFANVDGIGKWHFTFCMLLFSLSTLAESNNYLNKRLSQIVRTNMQDGELETVSLSYDDEDRLVGLNYEGDGESLVIDVSYNIPWSFSYEMENERTEATLEDNRVVKLNNSWFDGYELEMSEVLFEYDTEGHVTRMQYGCPDDYWEDNTLVWEGGNAISWKEDFDPNDYSSATMQYYDEQAHPIIHSLFSPLVLCVDQKPQLIELFDRFFFPYLGTAAKNLVSHIDFEETDDGGYYTSSCDIYYERVGNDVTLVRIVYDGGSEYLYTLSWETSNGIESPSRMVCKDTHLYSLSGMKIINPKKGLYVKRGKKFIVD